MSDSNVHLLTDDEMTDEARQIAHEIRSTLPSGTLPNFFRAIAHNPEHMSQVWQRIRTLMDPSAPDHKYKHLLSLAICAAVGSTYFASHHAAALRREGATEKEITEVLAVVELWTGLSALVSGLRLEFEGSTEG